MVRGNMPNKTKFILKLLNELITPALGCTEIGCIAYATSVASEHLKNKIKRVIVHMSGFIYRNVINVAVPSLGKVGAKGIAAAGLVMKQSHRKLLILAGITPQQIKLTKELMSSNMIKIEIEKHCDPVYVKVIAQDIKGNTCDVLIERKHDVIRSVKLNHVVLITNSCRETNSQKSPLIKFDVNDISLSDIFQTIKSLKIANLKFLHRGIDMNHKIALAGNQKQYYHQSSQNTS
jgi:L-cysteine desulfidase